MRKKYMTPSTETLDCIIEDLLSGSGVNSESGINYGGIDETGGLPPASRQFLDIEESMSE
jgi:hypothetical protein